MLINLKDILKIAEEKKIAIGAFNTPNLESLCAVISAAESLNLPVVIIHAQLHEEIGVCKMEKIAPLMRLYAEQASVPVCMQLDHGTDLDYIKRGIDLGFTSVMYDGSEEPMDVNRANTKLVVEMAHAKGVSVEAEVGCMGAREGGIGVEAGMGGADSIYTDPDEAAAFCAETGVDALACAFGTVHGMYLKEPKLDIERLEKIHSMIDAPIVMHGGSGVSDEDYRRVIAAGVRKINYYTYMAKAGAEAVVNMIGKTSSFHDMAVAAEEAMRKDVERAMRVFAGM